jgi:hypothetical protein
VPGAQLVQEISSVDEFTAADLFHRLKQILLLFGGKADRLAVCRHWIGLQNLATHRRPPIDLPMPVLVRDPGD